MKIIAFCLFTLSALGQEITDLGVITQHRGIILEKCTNRADFFQFKVELVAQRWPSNRFEFTTTNSMLTLDNFAAMPPGPCIMGVREITADSDESNISLYRVDVRRDPASAPRAHMVQIGTGHVRHKVTTEDMINSRQRNMTNGLTMPPLPPMPEGMMKAKAMVANEHPVTPPQPLPGGSSKTYSQYMIEMQNFYSRKGRRSQ